MFNWVQIQDTVLNSGRRSKFKIECDNLTHSDLSAMCELLIMTLPPFGEVSGVPRGGVRIENVMRPYITTGPLLIVDDVWTTGRSVDRHINALSLDKGYVGLVAVLFSRGPVPINVTSLFTIHPALWSM